ncbi:hypothetical protein TNCV_2267301 [Trichonephila clavipes]|nr:hypothetical protein TNCV_2267301 [Trichonephila clavipes]
MLPPLAAKTDLTGQGRSQIGVVRQKRATIPSYFTSLPHFINRISWRGIADQSFSNLWPDDFMGDRSGESTGQGNNRIPCASRKVRIWKTIYDIVFFFLKKVVSGVSKKDTTTRNVPICVQDTANPETFMSCSQWLVKASHKFQGP